MRGVVRIEPSTLSELSNEREKPNTTYFDSKIIQELYWNRFKQLISIVEGYKAERVLDVGCGEGVFLPTLSRAYPKVYGIDLDVRAAKKVVELFGLENVTLYGGDVFDNAFKDGFFDMIFAASVLEHFSDQERILGEIHRILKPGGLLVFSSPTESFLYQAGRRVFGYTKPLDHYYSVFEIAECVSKKFTLVKSQSGPLTFLPNWLAAYRVYVFRR